MRRSVLLVGRNLSMLMGSHVLNRLLYVALVGVIGRRLGAEILGGYAIAVAVGSGFLFVADFGLSPLLTREVAARPGDARRGYARAMGAKLAASGIALLVLPLLVALLPYQDWVRELCAWMALAALLESFSQLNNAVCRAKQRMELEAIAATTQAVVVVGGSTLALFAGLPPVALGWVAAAGSAAELVVSLVLVRRLVQPGIEFPPQWETVRAASPYAVSSLNAVAFFQAEILVLSFLMKQEQVGQFAAVFRLIQGAGYLAILAANSILPALTIAHTTYSRERFQRAGTSLLRAGLLASGAVAALTWSLAGPVMATVYGKAFAGLAPLLRLGAAYLFFKYLSETLSTLLVAAGRPVLIAVSRVLGAGLSWVLIGLMAPRLGVLGAVLALVTSELVVAVVQARRVGQFVQAEILVPTTGWLVAGLLATLLLWSYLQDSGSLLLAIALPPLAFGALMAFSGQLKLDLPAPLDEEAS